MTFHHSLYSDLATAIATDISNYNDQGSGLTVDKLVYTFMESLTMVLNYMVRLN